MNTVGLDRSWLEAWSREVTRTTSRMTDSFEETHGYPPGENTVLLADGGTRAVAESLGTNHRVPPALLSLYSVVDGVSLPDVGNGYFVHPPSAAAEHLDEYGAVRLTEDNCGVVFASDGGGTLYAIGADGRIHRSTAPSWVDEFEVVATDLRDFLEQLRRTVVRFVATGHPGRL